MFGKQKFKLGSNNFGSKISSLCLGRKKVFDLRQNIFVTENKISKSVSRAAKLEKKFS